MITDSSSRQISPIHHQHIGLIMMLGMVFLSLLVVGLWAGFHDRVARGQYQYLLFFVFPLAGGAFVYQAFRQWRDERRFGYPQWMLDPAPGCIGGDFGGSVDIPMRWTPDLTVQCVLRCEQVSIVRSSKGNRHSLRTVWQREGAALAEPQGNEVIRVQARIQIPAGLPESEQAARHYHRWLLEITAQPAFGPKFSRIYVVPVRWLATPKLSSLNIPYLRDQPAPEAELKSPIMIRQSDDQLVLHFPWWRKWKMALVLGVIGLLFGILARVIAVHDAPMIMVVFTALVSILFVFIGLMVIGHEMRVRIAPEGVDIRHSWLGLAKTKSIPRNHIVHLLMKTGGEMRVMGKATIERVFYLKTRDGKTHMIADAMTHSSVADQLQALINDKLGLSV